jgi:hypothetical protein
MAHKYKVGDKVKVKASENHFFKNGIIAEVEMVYKDGNSYSCVNVNNKDHSQDLYEDEMEPYLPFPVPTNK